MGTYLLKRHAQSYCWSSDPSSVAFTFLLKHEVCTKSEDNMQWWKEEYLGFHGNTLCWLVLYVTWLGHSALIFIWSDNSRCCRKVFSLDELNIEISRFRWGGVSSIAWEGLTHGKASLMGRPSEEKWLRSPHGRRCPVSSLPSDPSGTLNPSRASSLLASLLILDLPGSVSVAYRAHAPTCASDTVYSPSCVSSESPE